MVDSDAVAIKIIRPDQVSPDFQQRFEREIRVSMKLNHPNVYPVGSRSPPFLVASSAKMRGCFRISCTTGTSGRRLFLKGVDFCAIGCVWAVV